MEIRVYRTDTGRLAFRYPKSMEPELLIHTSRFTVVYLGVNEFGNTCNCICNFDAKEFYYEIVR